MIKLTRVNRLEVIDHTNSNGGEVRTLIKWVKANFEVYYQLQDEGRTLKLFLTDEEYTDD